MDKSISIRGGTLIGRVVSDKMRESVVVERETVKFYPKYKRYARSHSRIIAHNPGHKARVGDVVKIAETRKMSKRKAWIVVDVLKRGEKE